MSSLNKAIPNYKDVDNGCAHYFSPTCSSESTAGTFKSNINYSKTMHLPPNANNVIELEGPLHEDMRMRLIEIIKAGDPHAKDHRMKKAIAAEISKFGRRGTLKTVMRAEIR